MNVTPRSGLHTSVSEPRPGHEPQALETRPPQKPHQWDPYPPPEETPPGDTIACNLLTISYCAPNNTYEQSMPHSNCKPSNPQPPPVPWVAHPNSQGQPPNQRHSYESEQWSKPRIPYQEMLPPEPHPQPSGPPSWSGYPVDHATPRTPHSNQYYEEMYEKPPSNPSELDEYGYGEPAEGGPGDIGTSHSQHVNGPSSVVPGPHHSTGYPPKVNPHPDLNEPQLHNMPRNVPIPNTRHPRSVYGTHEVSSIHLQTPHPISQVGPNLLSRPLSITQPPPNPYRHGSQSYHSRAQPVDYVPPHRPNPQVNSLASLPPPHYPGNVSYAQQPNAPTNAQFPARDIRYYAHGGNRHQLPSGNGYPPTQSNGYPPTQDRGSITNHDPPQWEGHQNPRYPHSNTSELLMTLMANGNRRVTVVHHIEIKIPLIVACTNLVSSSPGTPS